jgi:thiol-disulfide isomerase/thioredoxin
VNERSRWRGALGGLLLLGLGSGLAAQEDAGGIPLGSTPPPVTIADLQGKPVALGDVIGRGPALVEFWATWCPLCSALEPKLAAAYARYHTGVRFVAVAVAVNETPAAVRRHLARHPMPYPYLWDTNGNATRAFQAPTTSFVVILDRTGKVSYTGSGVDQDLERALAAVAPLPPAP